MAVILSWLVDLFQQLVEHAPRESAMRPASLKTNRDSLYLDRPRHVRRSFALALRTASGHSRQDGDDGDGFDFTPEDMPLPLPGSYPILSVHGRSACCSTSFPSATSSWRNWSSF